MNKKPVVILIIIFGIIISACSRIEKPKVGFLLPNYTDARYLKDSSYFFEKIASMGGEAIIMSADNDFSKQENQAIEMLDNDIKTIVIAAVNQTLAAGIIRLAHERGVKIIAYERMIKNCDLDYFITYDHQLAGKQQAEFAVNYVPIGNYVILGGDKSDKNAELIWKGQHEVLSSYLENQKIKILYEAYIEDWSREDAYMELSKIINIGQEQINVVLAANDGIAEGAVKALKANQSNISVIVTGMDAELSACQRIIAGSQSMTIYKSFKKQACQAAELAMQIAANKVKVDCTSFVYNGYKDVPSISLSSEPIYSENIIEKIVSDKVFTKQELIGVQ